MPSRLEALADAFARMNGMLDPLSDAYRTRNPLLLKAFLPKHVKDEKGYRIFHSFSAGYDNGIIDLRVKCSGGSRSKLTPDSTLVDLVKVYDNKASAARYIKNFLRHALHDENIMESTKLGWFMEPVDVTAKVESKLAEIATE